MTRTMCHYLTALTRWHYGVHTVVECIIILRINKYLMPPIRKPF
jgi:hypothetical protein